MKSYRGLKNGERVALPHIGTDVLRALLAMIAIAVLLLIVLCTHALGANGCWAPEAFGKRVPNIVPLTLRGDCVRVVVAGLVKTCERYNSEDRAECYAKTDGQIKCVAVECEGVGE